MFELNSKTRVAELEAESAAMMAALKSTGIFRDGDSRDVMINDLCFSFGLNPAIILDILARAQAAEAPLDVDISELDGLTLTQVVENIASTHHVYLRETLPVIDELANKVANVHGDRDERLLEVRDLIGKVAIDLENHMLHEEEALFAMVRDLESGGAIRLTRCGDAVGGPIVCMENEHEQVRLELAKLRELTDDYAVPEGACMSWRELLGQLARFDQDMVVHMQKEDKVLFPGALEAQAALRQSN
jgi:regulator of cell morphogenesis and NO signaling